MWITPVFGCNDEIVLSDGSINTNYAGRPVGNSPEFMPLDNSLNQDIHCAVRSQVSATRSLPKDDPRRFSFATPESIKHAYGRCHCPRYDPNSAVPTPERIEMDINKVLFSLEQIMEAGGKVVPGLASRIGHRSYMDSCAIQNSNGGGHDVNEISASNSNAVKKKAKKMRWFHPDTCDALHSRWKAEGSDDDE